MKYFLDFDRTIFDTPAFKKSVARRPTLTELWRQLGAAIQELRSPSENDSRQRRFMRTLGTFLSHGRFVLSPQDLKKYLYPEVAAFLADHNCTIVTYGVEMFIRAKVISALTDLPVQNVVYTSRRKGPTIRRLTEDKEAAPFVFVDDARFQLESVARWCPEVIVIEIRRDSLPGDGRWPVAHTLDDLATLVART